MILKDKKGVEKVLSVYWFAVLVIIAGAVVAMAGLFYGTQYDVRDAEANLLANKAVNCLSENGKISEKVFSGEKKFREDFQPEEECGFIFRQEFSGEAGEYFLVADFYSLNDLNNKLSGISGGNQNLYSDCIIEKNKEYKLAAKCAEREFYSASPFSDEMFKIKIISAVRKTEKNVE